MAHDQADLTRLLLRTAIGGTMIAHGIRHARTLNGTAGWFESIGFRQPRLQAKLSAAVVWLMGALAIVTMLYTLWVPHEIVIMKPAPTGIGLTPNERAGYVLGYVLADEPGGWITILTSGSRTIVRFRDATVKSITVCERPPHGGISSIFYASPLWNFGSRSLHILSPGTYVKCP